MSLAKLLLCPLLIGWATAQLPDMGYNREQLQPLTNFRKQHRRTIDGRLCAAAFVQDRKTYTGCTTAPNPAGESGRPWCYVEAQVRHTSPAAARYAPTAWCEARGHRTTTINMELLRYARPMRWATAMHAAVTSAAAGESVHPPLRDARRLANREMTWPMHCRR